MLLNPSRYPRIRLTRAQAQRLAEAKGLVLSDQEDFSLAEIYCGPLNNTALSMGRQIAFEQ